jgi:hypothetical protein
MPQTSKRSLQDGNWVDDAREGLHNLKLLLSLGLGLLIVTPMTAIGVADALGVHGAMTWLLVLATYVVEGVTLVAIGRRARRAEAENPDAPEPRDAQIWLAALYVVVPIAALCAKGWYLEQKWPWFVGAVAVGVGITAQVLRILVRTASPRRA